MDNAYLQTFGDYGRMQIRVIVDVKAGDEILNCYGPRVGKMVKAERLVRLKTLVNSQQSDNTGGFLFAICSLCPLSRAFAVFLHACLQI